MKIKEVKRIIEQINDELDRVAAMRPKGREAKVDRNLRWMLLRRGLRNGIRLLARKIAKKIKKKNEENL